jgi:hypothetical protein
MRLRSGSLWTGAFLHASHNLFIQGFFTPLTTDTGPTEYVIDEFGCALALTALLVAVVFWRRRAAVEGVQQVHAGPDSLVAANPTASALSASN